MIFIMGDNYSDREGRRGGSYDSFMLKCIGWFILLCIAGFVVCVILGLLKVAVSAVVIIAAILLFIGLLGWVGYSKIKKRNS